jgi:feruloyl-CoA synthase
MTPTAMTQANLAQANPATRSIALGPYGATIQRRADGAIILDSATPLLDYIPTYNSILPHWARERPDQVFLAWRGKDGQWESLTFRQMLDKVLPLAQYLLGQNLSAERPLMILSGNSAENAMLALAAIHAGVTYVPLSPAYSLLSPSAERVIHAVNLLTPGLVFAQNAGQYANAITKAVPRDTPLLLAEGEVPGYRCTSLASALQTPVTAQVDAAFKAVKPDDILKFLFTSGSTKMPKAVINTHRMMTSNLQQHRQCYPYMVEDPPILVDWMPWHHTAAGNINFGTVLYYGGTLYIDEGKPTDEGMGQTINNLREVASTVYYTVPKGMEILAHAMKQDSALRDRFFSRMRLIFPCGAPLPAPLKQTVDELAVASCGQRIPMTMGLGQTESAPFAITAHLPDWEAGIIGVPAPGMTAKLAPVNGKLEVRYRGPNITPGYWRQPDITAEAYDEEGFFCSGDAAAFVDEANPARGLRFDGRIAEDFKLLSGTWVSVGNLRMRVISAGAPYIHDVAITGHGRDELGALIFLTPMAAGLAGLPEDAPMADVCRHPKVRAWAQNLLDTLAAQTKGSSYRIARGLLQERPASMEINEMTDKGSINQRNVLQFRASEVEKLYADPPSASVIVAAHSH